LLDTGSEVANSDGGIRHDRARRIADDSVNARCGNLPESGGQSNSDGEGQSYVPEHLFLPVKRLTDSENITRVYAGMKALSML
jgi:hypothetical protein